MGNILSGTSTRENATVTSDRGLSEIETMEDILDGGDKDNVEQFHDTVSDDDNRAKIKEEEMNEFRKQLTIKREQRKEILSRHRNEKKELEESLQNQIKSKLELAERNKLLRELLIKNNIDIPEELKDFKEDSDIVKAILQMKDEIDKLKSNNNKLRCELASSNNALQEAYSEIADLSAQNTESIKQIKALKEVITVSKTMIKLREEQLNELKEKLNEIEHSLADRETNMLSADLRQEYERQLQNIRTLRGLYEERARLAEVTRQALTRELQEQKDLNEVEVKKCNDLSAKVEELESTVNALEEAVEDKNNQISSCQDETRGLKAEMAVVNKVLLGYKNKQDLDKLVNRLEQNHGILTQMAEKENGSEASSALPKLLLQLVSQVEETEETKQSIKDEEKKEEESYHEKEAADIQNSGNAKAEEIVENLPKVWRVLMELLSHQAVPDSNDAVKVTTCYKSVETKSGPVLVPSVSQTYIRLKDLIIEKLTLIKEVNRMKQLNGHLETRLQEQERRLCLVTTELSKTWHVVGRLRRHHHQLHTHEKILKYELQQKRKLLNELKEELEYCREKWEQAREKNSQSEKDWKDLRAEFSSRKLQSLSTSMNNSAESGYSDERPSDDSSESNDESEYVKEPQIRCKKKIKKSFETALDSSADFNLVAEKEDPSSDLMDVTDLPLDNQEPLEASDSRGYLNKNEKTHVETEDEVGDIANDSCLEESSVAEHCENDSPFCDDESENVTYVDKENISMVKHVNNSTSVQTAETQVTIDPVIILNSMKEQSHTLSEKEKKNELLEKDGASLLQKSLSISNIEIDNALTHLINPSTSNKNNAIVSEEQTKLAGTCSDSTLQLDSETKENEQPTNQETITLVSNKLDQPDTTQDTSVSNNNDSFTSPETHTDFNVILENIKRQNERLALKDQRLQNLENGCTDVIKYITNTLQTGDQISHKLKILHNEYTKSSEDNPESGGSVDTAKITEERVETHPSTSNDMDHEAMFAARDMRLKRLEEQTKSLVNKVNKTATKGVKINYKLEELHNIYGSESSRAGTPSEDNEENSESSNNDKEK